MRYNVGDHPVPGYRLDAFLGAGSYGEVWKAVGPGGVPCALKFISMDSKSGLKEFRSIRLVKRLQHPNLCPVQAIWLRDQEGAVLSETGEDSISIRLGGPKELVIAMGLGHKSLTQRLEECRAKGTTGIPPRELLRYMTDAAKGIDYLNSPEHDLGAGPAAIIHCDIKPANLLIVGGGVQVCDYGVAKALAPDMKKTFAAGTPAYAPPELINNEPCASTDQYSLAITYYELRTGRLPFDEARAIIANLTGQLDLSGVGPDEQEVLKQATSKQPPKRFPTCEEFVEALKVAAGVTLGPSSIIPAKEMIRQTPQDGSGPHQALSPPPPKKSLPELLQPGEELVPDHFLSKQLGRGGYGEVWEARGAGGVRCALKVVRDLQGRGKHEFAVLDKIRELDHPNLIGLRGYWLLANDGTRIAPEKVGQPGVATPAAVVISTDLAEKNLLDRLKECRQDGQAGIPPAELVGYLRQAAGAIDYLNIRNHIQHRDIKPENLLLRKERLLVSDFGLAKLVEGDDGAVQSSSSGMTLEYAAPELLQKRVSSRTDQYSLALTYYTLRAGKMPFPAGMGQFDTMQARIRGRLDLSGVSEPERAVLRKALSPSPADRYESCELMARELAQALGLGTGPLTPQRPAGEVVRAADLYRSTPTPGSIPHPAPREAPVDLAEAPQPPGPPAAQTRSGGQSDTDTARPPARPARPASPARRTPVARGTMLPGDDEVVADGPTMPEVVLPAQPAAPWAKEAEDPAPPWVRPAEPKAKPEKRKPEPAPTPGAPWAEEAPKPRSGRKGSPSSPEWNKVEAEPKAGGGAGKLVLFGGLAVGILAGLGVAAYMVFVRNTPSPDTRTVASNTATTSATNGNGQTQPSTSASTGTRPTTQTTTKGGGNSGANGNGGTTKQPDPETERRLAKARKHFKAGEVQQGLDELDTVLKASPGGPTRETAENLRTSWKAARDAAGAKGTGYALVDNFRKAMDAAADGLGPADAADMGAFRRKALADKVRQAVPGLGDGTDWAELEKLCKEADQTPWVAACRAECAAESNQDGGSPPAEAGDPALDGYVRYVRALRDGRSNDSRRPEAAKAAAGLVPDSPPAAGTWANAHRFRRLADLLAEACKALRTPDDKDLEHPYAKPEAAGWLAAADRAAAYANLPAKDREPISYERLLAGWSRGADPALGPVGESLAKAESVANLPPGPRARFWVAYADTRPDDEAGRLARVQGYRQALAAVRAAADAAPRALFAHAVLVKHKLTAADGVAGLAGASAAAKKEAAGLLADAGRELYGNRSAWEQVKDLPGRPAAIAADLFSRAADQDPRAEYVAWQGICQADQPAVKVFQLDVLRVRAQKMGGGADDPAVLLLDAIVTARMPWKDAGRPDLKDQIAAAAAADGKYRGCLKKLAADPVPEDLTKLAPERRELLAPLLSWAGTNAITLANLDPTNPKREALLADAERWGGDLDRVAPGRADGLDLKACAEEDQAWLLKPADRFGSGAYAKADGTYREALRRAPARPETRMHQGRLALKITEDLHENAKLRIGEDTLGDALTYLKEAAKGFGNSKTAAAAECQYWLGRAAALQYETAGLGQKRRLYTDAVKGYTAAAALAEDPGAAVWADAVRQGLLDVHVREGVRCAAARDKDGAEAAAAALDALAGSDGSTPSATLKAKARAEAVRVRKRLDVRGVQKWYEPLKAAVEPGLAECQTQDRWVQFELRVMLAEATASERVFGVNKPEEGVKLLEPAAEAAGAAKLVRPAAKADVLGTLGFLHFQYGLANKKNKELLTAEWDAAREPLATALDLAPDHPKAWKWKYALSAVLLRDVYAAKNPARAATVATRVFDLFRDAEVLAFMRKNTPGTDQDDLTWANRIWNAEEHTTYFTDCGAALKKGLDEGGDAPEKVLWQLAVAEAAAASKAGGFKRGTGERDALNEALAAARKALPGLPAGGQKLGRQMTARLDHLLEELDNLDK